MLEKERGARELVGDYRRGGRRSYVGEVEGMGSRLRRIRRDSGIGIWHHRRRRMRRAFLILLGGDTVKFGVVVVVVVVAAALGSQDTRLFRRSPMSRDDEALLLLRFDEFPPFISQSWGTRAKRQVPFKCLRFFQVYQSKRFLRDLAGQRIFIPQFMAVTKGEIARESHSLLEVACSGEKILL